MKQIPKEGENKHPEHRKYIYHDKDGNKHSIGDFKLITVSKKSSSDDIITNAEGKVELVHFGEETFKGYESSDGKVKCKVAKWKLTDWVAHGGKRDYINPECLAGLLGAMLDYSIDFLTFRGSSKKLGGGHPSVSHVNGLKNRYCLFQKRQKSTTSFISRRTIGYRSQC